MQVKKMRISGLDDGERGEVVISVEKVWTQVLFFAHYVY